MNNNCLFCKIIKGVIPCYKIYEDEKTLAFLDISRNPEGHTLVIPKEHSVNMFDANESSFAWVMKTVQKVSQHYKNIGYADGINIYVNNGIEAGQEVMHLHVHIIPRHSDDQIAFSHTQKVSSVELSEICDKLKIK